MRVDFVKLVENLNQDSVLAEGVLGDLQKIPSREIFQAVIRFDPTKGSEQPTGIKIESKDSFVKNTKDDNDFLKNVRLIAIEISKKLNEVLKNEIAVKHLNDRLAALGIASKEELISHISFVLGEQIIQEKGGEDLKKMLPVVITSANITAVASKISA